MKIAKMSVVDRFELEQAVELQFGLEPDTIDMIELFGEECENDSYQLLDFSDSKIEYVQEKLNCLEQRNRLEEANQFRYRLLVLTYLHDILPGETEILWLCAW